MAWELKLMEQPRVDGADRKAILDLLSAAKIDCYDDCLSDAILHLY